MISYQLAPRIQFHIALGPDVKIAAVTLVMIQRPAEGVGGLGGFFLPFF